MPHNKYVLGTPETKRKGLKTLNARNALTSNPSGIIFCRTALSILTIRNKNNDVNQYQFVKKGEGGGWRAKAVHMTKIEFSQGIGFKTNLDRRQVEVAQSRMRSMNNYHDINVTVIPCIIRTIFL